MQKKVVYIDSGSQLTSSKNIWSNQIDMNFEGDYNRITVLQSQIPVSYYVIGAGANTFTLTEGSSSVTITISPANYNVFSFSTTVGALMTLNSPNSYTYTINYPNAYTSPDTGLLTYSVNSIAKTVSLTFPARSPLSEQFGFITGSTNYFTVSGLNQTLTSVNVVNFTPENSLYIRCNFCDGESTSEQSDVLLAVYGSNVQPYSTITFTNPCPIETSKRLTSRDRNLVFSVCDENALPIYMNGGNIQMALLFYKDETVNTSIEEYIAMKTRFLELDVNEKLGEEKTAREDQVQADANKASDQLRRTEGLTEKEASLTSREEVLRSREEDLARREEVLKKDDLRSETVRPTDEESAGNEVAQLQNNVVNNINGSNTQNNVNPEIRPEDTPVIPNDRE